MLKKILARKIGWFLNKYSNADICSGSFCMADLRNLHITFSVFGEDLLVSNLLKNRGIKTGVFIDVGAFAPVSRSNTRLLSLMGWKGINIDMDEYKIDRFKEIRPRDYSVVAAVSSTGAMVKKLSYNKPATDRIVPVDCHDLCNALGELPVAQKNIPSRTLQDIVDASPYKSHEVQYLDIDCEGADFDVLKSLDFQRCRPMVISIEALTPGQIDPISEFLDRQRYREYARVNITGIYERID